MKKLLILGCLALGMGGVAQAMGKHDPVDPLETVAHVDLERYMGRWYEIARLPQSFEKDCVGVTADYTLRENGKVTVINTCRKKSLDGPVKRARGVARVVDEKTNARLEVSFFWPFWGDYWILELGSNYEYVAVGDPSRESLWILSRTPKMNEQLVQGILQRRAKQGFDVSKMERPEQFDN